MDQDFLLALVFAVVGGGGILGVLLIVHWDTRIPERQVIGFLGTALALVLVVLTMTFVHPQKFVRDDAFFNTPAGSPHPSLFGW